MNTTATTNDGPRWLLLIHQIPPKPDYLRVKIGRRLQRVGAVPVKNSVYVLPDNDQSFEDFQWIRAEIVEGGGDAAICRAAFVDGLPNDTIQELFRTARDADYDEIATAARELFRSLSRRDDELPRGRTPRPDEELVRLRKRLTAVAAIDYFESPERAMAKDALDIVEAQLAPRREGAGLRPLPLLDRTEYHGRTWVTRSGIYVDRIASAWLIRRFIDPHARFNFVLAVNYRRTRDELRFDMFEAEFTHEGDRCTFETLVERFSFAEPALRPIAEIVHDIDMKDGKFGREDAAGIERVLAGIVRVHADDVARLERGCQLFDELYALFSTEAQATQATESGAQ